MARGGKGKRFKISPKLSLRKSVVTAPRRVLKVGRNDPCPCGSGEKYKNCCIKKGEAFLRKMAKKQAKSQHSEAKKQGSAAEKS
jgi:hypothetical protein